MVFTMVCAPYCSADRSGLLILPLVNGFHAGFHAVLPNGWQRIAHTAARPWLSRRFAHRIAERMAADYSFLHSSTALTTVFAPYFSAGGVGLLILSLVNCFHHGLRAVLLSGWQRIAHTSARQRLSRWIARRIAPRMAADCSYVRLSTAFTTVCLPYFPAYGSGFLTLGLVNGFHDGLHAVLLSGCQSIAHSSARQRLPRRFLRRITQRMAADGSGLLMLPLINGFHDGLRTVLLSGWQQMAADCSFFHSSTAFMTVCIPYCSADGSGLLILALVNGFYDSFRAVLISGWQQMAVECSVFRSSMAFMMDYAPYCSADGSRWQQIAHSSAPQWLFRCFACRTAFRMAADCSFLHSSMVFTTVFAPYFCADGGGLLIHPLVNGFSDVLRAVLLRGWQQINHTSARQRVPQWFSHRMAQRIAADCSFFHTSKAFTTD